MADRALRMRLGLHSSSQTSRPSPTCTSASTTFTVIRVCGLNMVLCAHTPFAMGPQPDSAPWGQWGGRSRFIDKTCKHGVVEEEEVEKLLHSRMTSKRSDQLPDLNTRRTHAERFDIDDSGLVDFEEMNAGLRRFGMKEMSLGDFEGITVRLCLRIIPSVPSSIPIPFSLSLRTGVAVLVL